MSYALLPPPPKSRESARMRNGLITSAAVHGLFLLAVVVWSNQPEPVRPPVYRVSLVGAPAGPRQVGVVDQRARQAAQSEQPAPSGAQQVAPPPKQVPTTTKTRTQQQARATPTPTKTRQAGTKTPAKSTAQAPPKAGSGEKGGKGADVATIRTEGLAFPDQAYLDNIIRRLTLAWRPRDQTGTRIAEIRFTIQRNGKVSDMQVMKASGDRLYDIEARGAIEAVGNFGPLPAAWTDDVLIVYFTFDYAMLK